MEILLWVGIGALIVVVIVLIFRHILSTKKEKPSALTIDKNVQFTVYRPSTIVPEKWYTLLAFAHLSKRRPSAPKDEPDPIETVRVLAEKILKDQPAEYEPAKLDRGFVVPQKGLLTFVPLIEGCVFNPPNQSIHWLKDVHKVEFEMKASDEVDGQAVEGQMSVYLGHTILTEVPLRINVDSQYVEPQARPDVFEESSAEPYRKIFASYSHKDTEIVEDFENYLEAVGDQYLRDVKTLRSGEVWSERLEEMIRDASVFQLFWSSNSMPSKFVKQEWEYALRLGRPKFIRPVYWEEPMPESKPDLPPEALKRLHFHKLPTHERRRTDKGPEHPGRSFTTTTATETLRADAKGHVEAVFTVTNTSARPSRGLAKVRPLGDTKQEWLRLQGDAERDFASGATQQFTVSFDGPASVVRKCPFRLDVASALNPDEDFTEGPIVTVEMVARTVPTKKKFPLWIIFVVLGVVLLIGGVVLWLVLRNW